MLYRHDDLYQDPTWFDALGAWCLARWQRCLPSQRARLWSTGFALFAALCVAWAAGLAAHCVIHDLPWNQCAAQLLAALLLLASAQHFLAATGLSARAALPRRKLVTRTEAPVVAKTAPPATTAKPLSKPAAPVAPPRDAEADARPFFSAVKAAGINVRIARTLYAAGFRSAEQVRATEDARLLAIPGIGQATLRKLRLRFGLPGTGAVAQSNAA
jgi:hypothetical protein